jgi:hypothetical protein
MNCGAMSPLRPYHPSPSPMLQAERIESLKAGVIAAAAMGVALAGIWGLRLPIGPGPTRIWWLEGASALIAGFLFGITYRYIVRQDQNSHLKSGAILAFGLVRGLAQISPMIAEGLQQINGPLPLDRALLLDVGRCGLIVLESITLFAVAQLALDQALNRSWVQPFKGL